MPNRSSRESTATRLVSKLRTREKVLLGIAAVVTIISMPSACIEISRGNYVTGLVIAGAPLLPLFRSSEILSAARRRGGTMR